MYEPGACILASPDPRQFPAHGKLHFKQFPEVLHADDLLFTFAKKQNYPLFS